MKKKVAFIGLLMCCCGNGPDYVQMEDKRVADTLTYMKDNCVCYSPFTTQTQLLLTCTVITRMFMPPIIECVGIDGSKYMAEAE